MKLFSSSPRSIYWIILSGIILLGFTLRLYKIDNPIADWHSWRQADTAAVARNFIKVGIDPQRPIYDDLSNVQSGKDNPKGYRMVEFPLYQLASVIFYNLFPQFPIEIWLRMIAIFSSLGAIFFLAQIVRKYIDDKTAILAAFIFAVMPYSIYYSRAILPEMPAVFLSLAAIYVFSMAIDKSDQKWILPLIMFLVSALMVALALLVKVTAVFLLLPIGYLSLRKWGFKTLVTPVLYVFGIIAVLPILWWRIWIQNFPEGIPAYAWLLNGGNIRFTGAFFRWILAERMGKLILGYGGFVLFWLGVAVRPIKKEGIIFLMFLLGILLYFIIFARGNIQHDYYQILFIPVASVFIAKGLILLLTPNTLFSGSISLCLAISLFLMMIAFSWFEVRGFYWINHPEIIEAGRIVDRLTPKDVKVIAPYGGDTAFLYQTNRQGWPVTEKPMEEMVKMGASFFVAVNPDKDVRHLGTEYKVIIETDKYILLDLTKKP